mmetsp:Transcript_110386/g.313200  ORF Transcript_110386/g.313200 Transcript_110386/m.313200 type:complete len:245 (-) Transcript_110386:321-1055(-)
MADAAEADSPASKRQKVSEHRGYSIEPDVTLVVEGEEFKVQSLILMMVSPVFRQMLTLEMDERRNRVIHLPDKKKDEFKVFWNVLQPMSQVLISASNAVFLSRWANEYDVEAMKSKCEDILCAGPVDFPLWQHAVAHNLTRLEGICARTITARLADHVGSMTALIGTVSEEILQKIWPHLCKQAKIEAVDMPTASAIRSFWPFISKAVRLGAAKDNAPADYLWCSNRSSSCRQTFQTFSQKFLV